MFLNHHFNNEYPPGKIVAFLAHSVRALRLGALNTTKQQLSNLCDADELRKALKSSSVSCFERSN